MNYQNLIIALYFIAISIATFYSFHRILLTYLYLKNRKRFTAQKALEKKDVFPCVTVQIPLFNEVFVVRRLLTAICALQYPRDRMQIQILDDSTDETSAVARWFVRKARRQGYWVDYLHRQRRRGFKAGALQEGLGRARGEYLAIFDADFVPPKDFLRKTLPYFSVHPRVAMVQARWGHLNRNASILTRIQALLLDGHFLIEHTARNRSGRFFGFNGAAGVWRKRAIEDSGGWNTDTLTEDLDISYRAQMRGWRFVYLPQIEARAELPTDINAFRAQQGRWTKGNIQTARKLLLKILASPLSWKVKLEAFFHLTNTLAYPFLLTLSILLYPVVLWRLKNWGMGTFWVDLGLAAIGLISFFFYYALSQKIQGPSGIKRLIYLPLALSLGAGLSLNNTKAVLEGLWGKRGKFERTPKQGILENMTESLSARYRIPISRIVVLELALGVYFSYVVFRFFQMKLYMAIPFVMLFQTGFLFLAFLSIRQTLQANSSRS